ncbi:MAG: hypothetical protein LPK14_13805 [Hymenobacteraceae bacterium]|nr:hypothetical protein [Hymenobacteraceae bacterium]
MQLYFKNGFVTLSYNREKRLGKAVWTGRLRGPELREAYLLCLEMVNRFHLTRWLADDRGLGAIDPEDLQWSLEVYVPRLAATSLLRMARLPSVNDKGREAVDIMIDKGHTFELDLILRDFPSEAEAMNWLMEPLPV